MEVELLDLDGGEQLDELEAGEHEVDVLLGGLLLLLLLGGATTPGLLLLSEDGDEEREEKWPDLSKEVVEVGLAQADNQDTDAKQDEDEQEVVGGLGVLDDVGDLVEELLELVDVLVALAHEDDEAHTHEGLDSALVLRGLLAPEGVGERDLLEVRQEDVTLLVVSHHPVHDAAPVLDGLRVVALEEVILIEDVQDTLAEVRN